MSRFITPLQLSEQDFERMKGKDQEWIYDYLEYNDTGKRMDIYTRKEVNIPSSHYRMLYQVKRDRDFIEFEFSLPKLLYGTNITQFVTSPGNHSNVWEREDWKKQKKLLFDRLLKQIKMFLNSIGSGAPIDYTLVEITRVDLCYNQIFPSKRAALGYLEWQKNIKKKYSRDSSDSMQSYKTSISYRTSNYTFKIYHKGAEYEKHDAKRHAQINSEAWEKRKKHLQKVGMLVPPDEQKKFEIFDIKTLQSVADRMLRYEITIRKDYMSLKYMENFFRRCDSTYMNKKDLYIKIKNNTKSGDRRIETFHLTWKQIDKGNYSKKLAKLVTKNIRLSSFKGEDVYEATESNPFEYMRNAFANGKKVIKKEAQMGEIGWTAHRNKDGLTITIEYASSKAWKFYNEFKNSHVKRRSMRISLDEFSNKAVKRSVCSIKESFHLPFSKSILGLMVDNFERMIQSYQIKEMPTMAQAEQRIKEYNARLTTTREEAKERGESYSHITRVNMNKLMFIIRLMQDHKLEDIPDVMNLNERTWRRYKADLRKVNIDQTSLAQGTELLQSIKTDFTDYYELCDQYHRQLYVNKYSFFNT
ncbi:phage/plasmid replication domain-containing protein [Sanyastnella coralliicola]|uniref:phage/plasmid replication domain-containing protein n=1 Tax=Sanyastnella coralliicola TaxID=3069118 RepID=UPI0027B8AA7E|nr:phage/plasmid replication protein [Longitalea sp. SCSIO 12813]